MKRYSLKQERNKYSGLSQKICKTNFDPFESLYVQPKIAEQKSLDCGMQADEEPLRVDKSLSKVPLMRRRYKSAHLKRAQSMNDWQRGKIQRRDFQFPQKEKDKKNKVETQNGNLRHLKKSIRYSSFFSKLDELYREIKGAEMKTKKNIENEGLEKQSQIQKEIERIKKMISQGLVNPDRANYTFGYDGKLISFSLDQLCRKKTVQVESKLCDEIVKSKILNQINTDKNEPEIKLKKNSSSNTKQLNLNTSSQSQFLKNFDHLKPVHQALKKKKTIQSIVSKKRPSDRSKNSFQFPDKKQRDRVSILDSDLLKNQIFEVGNENENEKYRSFRKSRAEIKKKNKMKIHIQPYNKSILFLDSL